MPSDSHYSTLGIYSPTLRLYESQHPSLPLLVSRKHGPNEPLNKNNDVIDGHTLFLGLIGLGGGGATMK